MSELVLQTLKDYSNKKTIMMEKFFLEMIDSLHHKNEKAKFLEINTELINKVKEISKLGKGLRGALMVLAYELSGKKASDDVYKVSLILELFHAGVLIHDDIMDNDILRRGVTTVHKHFENYAKNNLLNEPEHYGMSMGINAGDINFFSAIKLLTETSLDHSDILETLKVYSYFTTRVVLGQALDLTNYGNQKIDEAYVKEIHKYKTAEYTGVLPVLMGATLAGVKDEKILSALKTYGESLGWAFQIKDDILGTFSEKETLGKPVESDIREGKNTILLAEALRQKDNPKVQELISLYGNSDITAKEIQKVKDLFLELGTLRKAEEIGWKYVKEAEQQIPIITQNTEQQNTLREFVRFMMIRNA